MERYLTAWCRMICDSLKAVQKNVHSGIKLGVVIVAHLSMFGQNIPLLYVITQEDMSNMKVKKDI